MDFEKCAYKAIYAIHLMKMDDTEAFNVYCLLHFVCACIVQNSFFAIKEIHVNFSLLCRLQSIYLFFVSFFTTTDGYNRRKESSAFLYFFIIMEHSVIFCRSRSIFYAISIQMCMHIFPQKTVVHNKKWYKRLNTERNILNINANAR